MLTYTSSVTIDRPPGEVFSYLAEPEKQAQWSDVPMRRLTGGPFGVGTRMELSFGRRPLRATVVLEVTALERDQRFGFTTVSGGPIQWDGEYRLEAIGTAGTRVSQEGRLRFRGLWRLAEPIVGAEIRHNEIKEARKAQGCGRGRAALGEVPHSGGRVCAATGAKARAYNARACEPSGDGAHLEGAGQPQAQRVGRADRYPFELQREYHR